MWLFLEEQRGLAFLNACAWGFVIGLIYDAFRISRVLYSGGNIKQFFEDFFFCIMAACVFTVCCFNISLGIVRMFIAFGALLGFFTYRFTFGIFTVKLAKWLKALILPHLLSLKNSIKSTYFKISANLYTKRCTKKIFCFTKNV